MTQNEKVRRHLMEYGSITTFDAFIEYGITRLAARVSDLKADGMNIKSVSTTGKNRYGESVHYSRYYVEDKEC